ncbi:class I adenylate-forming enzyme family protein [Cryptosporangium minutisporangium]|uniref:Cyclohexanecarboxylate-CoA ligase n=1 Tax=Cryptosporangium minutisporangium TaxID=113569 RepID=A0ABP6T0W8_9ACTN
MPTTVAAFWDLVEESAQWRPAAVMLSDDHGRSLTTVAFRTEAERVAAGLHARGVTTGDVVSWQLPTTLEAAVLMAACARLGAVQNPIIPNFRAREVTFIVDQVRSRLVVIPEAWNGFDHGDMARTLGRDVLPVALDGPPGAAIRLPGDITDPLPAPSGPSTACRWIYYSSGTTAEPKGARHTDRSALAASNGVVDQLGLRADDVYPIAWPIAHIGGVAMLGAALRTGARLVLFDTFDPPTTPDRMAAHRPTILGSATPFFQAYVAAQRRHGDRPLFPELRACVGGGAPTPEAINQQVADVLGVPGVAGSWGLTEFPVATSETPADDGVGCSVGRPAHGVEVRVVGGELRLNGPQKFLGYVDASLDAEAFDDDGWVRTGDLGVVDGDGRVRISGRRKDVILRNAENISASEVEEVVLRCPGVADAAVIGVPDARTGERVRAVVVTVPGIDVSLADVVEHCRRAGLARYKWPEDFRLADAIPRNAMGKVVKRELTADGGR